jgi:hypothetical protein
MEEVKKENSIPNRMLSEWTQWQRKIFCSWKTKNSTNNTTTQRAVQNGSNRRQPADNPSRTARLLFGHGGQIRRVSELGKEDKCGATGWGHIRKIAKAHGTGGEEDQGKEKQERQTKRLVGATAGHRKQKQRIEWNEVRNESDSDDSDRDEIDNSIDNKNDREQERNVEWNEVETRGSMANENRDEIDSSDEIDDENSGIKNSIGHARSEPGAAAATVVTGTGSATASVTGR